MDRIVSGCPCALCAEEASLSKRPNGVMAASHSIMRLGCADGPVDSGASQRDMRAELDGYGVMNLVGVDAFYPLVAAIMAT
jgi:hypothetical protein